MDQKKALTSPFIKFQAQKISIYKISKAHNFIAFIFSTLAIMCTLPF